MKIIMQYDPNFGFMGEAEPEALLHALFYDVDTRQERPDIIIWETHCFMEQECSNNLDTYTVLTQRGIDMMQRIIDETHRRGIKAYWHHRISEVDAPPASFHSVVSENIIKKAHPDWLIRTWYEKGLWNLAVPEVQEFKVAYIKKMTERYPFDGICIDFLRHLPCLPPDAQWEHRDCVTDFMGKIRAAIPKDMKLGAKLPENAASCRVDGFDVAQWVKNGSLDFVLAGSRSVSSDVAWYKSITEGTNVEVYPCWDIWHCSDACHWREDAFYRGVFANWIAEKADGRR
ncbi:MAG: hypothetical protein E7463_08345, partial [Ruminococcaceae bacterium]|nr:hypothetical protein [Oscillospiraceae bacterium]